VKVVIDDTLVRRLVAGQFPRWAKLPIRPVAQSGWDNRTFHLGEHMIVRLPSGSGLRAFSSLIGILSSISAAVASCLLVIKEQEFQTSRNM